MPRKQLHFDKDFSVALKNKSGEAAVMVIAPGDSEGGPDNRHRGSDQWLFVVSGSGTAILNGRRQILREATLLLIEKGTKHEIRNTGKKALKTLNFYTPPAYTPSGDPLPRGRK